MKRRKLSCDTDFPALPSSRQTSVHLPDDHGLASGSRHSTPPVPPGFEAVAESRRSTPTVPPGFVGKAPSALPNLDDDGTLSRPGSRPASRAGLKRQASNQILPVVPLRPSTPRMPTSGPATPKVSHSDLKSEVKLGSAAVDETPTKGSKSEASVAKKLEENVKIEAPSAVAPPTPASEQEKAPDATPAKTALPENQRPAVPETPSKIKPSAKADQALKVATETVAAPKTRKSSAPIGVQPKGQATVQASDAKAASVTPSKPDKKDEKRKHPGKLDITAAVSKRDEATATATKPTPAESSTPSKPQRSVSQAPSLASKAESPIVPSPLTKTAPRTLRVVQTPKAEVPPPAFPTSGLPTPSLSTGKLPSRQPSIASINPPGTPSSEQVSISDAISIASTSQSRASSPPPGPVPSRVGSAPVREKTKSQLKKERQEKAKAMVEAEGSVTPIAEEPAQEAILSRKKKSKKEKEMKPKPAKNTSAANETAQTTPTASRAPSPAPKPVVVEAAKERPTTPAKPSTPAKPPVDVTPVRTPVQTAPAPMPSPHEPSPPPTPTLTAASLLAELKNQSPELQKCIDSLFRTPTSTQYKPNQSITPKDLHNPAFWKADFKINLTKDEVDALLSGTIPAINYGGQEGRVWDRGMITSTGSHLRALTEELEARFLDLEQALREIPEEMRFRPSKPQNEIKFPDVDLEALKRSFDNMAARGPSVMEQMVQDGSTMKKGAFLVDEASKYINEFVMPPATPPPSAGGTRGGQQQQTAGGAVGGSGNEQGQPASPSLDLVERHMQDAKRTAEEHEGRLKKLLKKNKRLLGLG
ncbi:hypothetical protein LTR56_013782 [Elasticomyces elasticus]|nr:hypothetical protein LTR56_013782 [Elasticomyces elasticus]KAK4907106.1 hypothetical protein LTR49_023849 [Elasticomyces elasticus]